MSGIGASGGTLQDALDTLSVPGTLWHADGEPGDVRCVACAHRCLIREGRRGVCRVRFNEGGVLRVPHGYVVALQCDPIEKKPFFHVLPGSDALTFGMLGCDFHCGYCQNWLTSQALRDASAGTAPTPISAEAIVGEARRRMARRPSPPPTTSRSSPPNGRMEIFRLGRGRWALRTGCVLERQRHAGGTRLPRDPWTDAFKIDLEAIARDSTTGPWAGRCENVLDYHPDGA